MMSTGWWFATASQNQCFDMLCCSLLKGHTISKWTFNMSRSNYKWDRMLQLVRICKWYMYIQYTLLYIYMIIHVSHVGSRLYICGILYHLPKLHMSNILQPLKAYHGTSCRTCGLFQRSRVQKTAIPKNGSHSISLREPQHTPGIPNSPKWRELQIINCLYLFVGWAMLGYVPGVWHPTPPS